MTLRVQVVTPWYPDYASVYRGVFVEQQVRALRQTGLSVDVEVPLVFPAPTGPLPNSIVGAIKDLGSADPSSIYPTVDGVTWIPTPVASRSGYARRVIAFAASISQKRALLPVSTDVTHAHLGVPTGAAIVEVGEFPLVVTEHQSTLNHVLREPAARRHYLGTIEAADRFFVVSASLRNYLRDVLGKRLADRIEVMPNIVDLSDIQFVDRRENSFSNWIYVGAMRATKGIRLLVKSFLEYRLSFDPEATLSIVGDGDQRNWVDRVCAKHGIEQAVSIYGSIPRSEVGKRLELADIMVHMSPRETFGISALEGLGAGLPVVSLRNGGSESTWGGVEESAGTILSGKVDPRSVAVAVDQLRQEQDRLDLRRVRRFVEESFSARVVGGQLHAAYEEVAAA